MQSEEYQRVIVGRIAEISRRGVLKINAGKSKVMVLRGGIRMCGSYRWDSLKACL